MKTNPVSRLCALAISAVFATIATAGVAVMMTSAGEQARTEFSVRAPAQPGTGGQIPL